MFSEFEKNLRFLAEGNLSHLNSGNLTAALFMTRKRPSFLTQV